MKKFMFKMANVICSVAMFSAILSAQGICLWKDYQPEVPQSLIND